MLRAFPDLRLTEEEVIETDDRIVVRRQCTGTHSAEWLGVAPTGKRVQFDAVDIYRLGADGRIDWHFIISDWNHVRLQLLGEAPDLPTTPTRRAVQAERATAAAPPDA